MVCKVVAASSTDTGIINVVVKVVVPCISTAAVGEATAAAS